MPTKESDSSMTGMPTHLILEQEGQEPQAQAKATSPTDVNAEPGPDLKGFPTQIVLNREPIPNPDLDQDKNQKK